MNTFNFIGTIYNPNETDLVKFNKNNKKYLRLLIRQNENNSAYVQMYGDALINGSIPVFFKNNTGRQLIKFEDRLDPDIISQVSFISKYCIEHDGKNMEFIWKDDFMEYASSLIKGLPNNTIYEISGEYSLSIVENKTFNNFNIKTIKVVNSARPEFKLKLELFYNHNSLDEKDKKNKLILNAFIEQYVFSSKRKEYFPIQVQFITNRFDFKNPTDVDVIKHRKANMHPLENEGYVKAVWEAQYLRGAQLFMPTLETLPKDIQFEIQNAGRDIKEYMGNVVGEANEFICLTRPDNTLNKEGKVYVSLNCTENEFKSKITQNFMDTISQNNTLDGLAKDDAKNNPFN